MGRCPRVLDVTARWRAHPVAVERIAADAVVRAVRAGPFLVELDHDQLRVDGAPVAAPALLEKGGVTLAIDVDQRARIARDDVELDPDLFRAVALGVGAVLALIAMFLVSAPPVDDATFATTLGPSGGGDVGASGTTARSVRTSFAAATARPEPRALPDAMFAALPHVVESERGPRSAEDNVATLLDAIRDVARRDVAGASALVQSAQSLSAASLLGPAPSDALLNGLGPSSSSGATPWGPTLGIGTLGARGGGVSGELIDIDAEHFICILRVPDPVDVDLERKEPPRAPEWPVGIAVEGEWERSCPDAAEIKRAVQRMMPTLRQCYASHAERAPYTFDISWEIDVDGRFHDASAQERDHTAPAPAGLGRCIERVLSTGRALTGCDGEVTVRYPFLFTPGD